MAQGKSEEIVGSGCFIILVIGAIWWFCYTFFYAPSHRDTGGPPPAAKSKQGNATDPHTPEEAVRLALSKQGNLTDPRTPEEAVRIALVKVLPEAAPRLEFLQGGNLEIYLTRHEFEVVPYPDRADVVQRIGEAWCKKVEHTYLPVVRLRDIRTGEEFGSFSCTTGHVSIREHY
jgi:hypothetical protein